MANWTSCMLGPPHPRDTGKTSGCPDCWYACQHPEMPHAAGRTNYSTSCPACMIAARAAILAGHGDEEGFVTSYGEIWDPVRTRLDEWFISALEVTQGHGGTQ